MPIDLRRQSSRIKTSPLRSAPLHSFLSTYQGTSPPSLLPFPQNIREYQHTKTEDTFYRIRTACQLILYQITARIQIAHDKFHNHSRVYPAEPPAVRLSAGAAILPYMIQTHCPHWEDALLLTRHRSHACNIRQTLQRSRCSPSPSGQNVHQHGTPTWTPPRRQA
jgi:hypothetical protein